MILREKLTPCLPFLHITFGSRFKKKRKKKTPALQGNFLVHEYNLKIPFQCFISINSNTDPNLSNTFNLVTSSLLLMGQVSFPIPLGFQSQVEDQPETLHNANSILQIFVCVKKKIKRVNFLIPRRVGYLKSLLISFSYHMPGFSLIEVASLYHLRPIIIEKTMTTFFRKG